MSCTSEPIIFWLDCSIGGGTRYQTLKALLSKVLHLQWIHSICLSIINAVEICTFSDEMECTQCLQNSRSKRIFLLISNYSSTNFPKKIVEDHGNSQNISIYILCESTSEIQEQLEHHVRIDESATNLLARLVQDIGDYFVCLGQEQLNKNTYQSLSQACKNFNRVVSIFERFNHYYPSIVLNGRISIAKEYITKAKQLLEQVIVSQEREQLYRPNSYENIIEGTAVDVKQSCHSGSISLNFDVEIILFKPSCPDENFRKICTNLTNLFGKNSIYITEDRNYQQLLKRTDSTIIVLSSSNDDDALLLDNLCSCSHPSVIYILGRQPVTPNEKKTFFTKYYSIRYMSDDPEELTIQIAIDMALKHRISGYRHAREQNQNSAVHDYDQCIGILDQLNAFGEINVK